MNNIKKSYWLITSLALSPSLLFASTPPALGYIDATIGVKNTTGDTINVSCTVGTTPYGANTLGGPQSISAGGAVTFSGRAGDGCSVYSGGNNQINDTNIICDYTDTNTGSTGAFILGACQNYTAWSRGDPNSNTYSNNIYTDAYNTPPTPYNCDSSTADYTTTNASFQCSSGNMSASYSTCKVEAYFAVGGESDENITYSFTWDDIDMPEEQGKTFVKSLASKLSKTGHYGEVTSSYDKEKKQIAIKLPPASIVHANPYEGMTNIGQCRNACVPS